MYNVNRGSAQLMFISVEHIQTTSTQLQPKIMPFSRILDPYQHLECFSKQGNFISNLNQICRMTDQRIPKVCLVLFAFFFFILVSYKNTDASGFQVQVKMLFVAISVVRNVPRKARLFNLICVACGHICLVKLQVRMNTSCLPD